MLTNSNWDWAHVNFLNLPFNGSLNKFYTGLPVAKLTEIRTPEKFKKLTKISRPKSITNKTMNTCYLAPGNKTRAKTERLISLM